MSSVPQAENVRKRGTTNLAVNINISGVGRKPSVYIAHADVAGPVKAFNVYLAATKTAMFMQTFPDPFAAADAIRLASPSARIVRWEAQNVPVHLDADDWKAVARARSEYLLADEAHTKKYEARLARIAVCEEFKKALAGLGVPFEKAEKDFRDIEAGRRPDDWETANGVAPTVTVDGVTFRYSFSDSYTHTENGELAPPRVVGVMVNEVFPRGGYRWKWIEKPTDLGEILALLEEQEREQAAEDKAMEGLDDYLENGPIPSLEDDDDDAS